MPFDNKQTMLNLAPLVMVSKGLCINYTTHQHSVSQTNKKQSNAIKLVVLTLFLLSTYSIEYVIGREKMTCMWSVYYLNENDANRLESTIMAGHHCPQLLRPAERKTGLVFPIKDFKWQDWYA